MITVIWAYVRGSWEANRSADLPVINPAWHTTAISGSHQMPAVSEKAGTSLVFGRSQSACAAFAGREEESSRAVSTARAMDRIDFTGHPSFLPLGSKGDGAAQNVPPQ